MNWVDQEALEALSQRGRPGARLVRGMIWAVAAIFLISVLLFLALSVFASRGEPTTLF